MLDRPSYQIVHNCEGVARLDLQRRVIGGNHPRPPRYFALACLPGGTVQFAELARQLTPQVDVRVLPVGGSTDVVTAGADLRAPSG